MAEQLGSNVLTVLDFDELIPTAELFAAKLALLLSPGHRCTFTTEFSFWPWFWDEADQAEDLVALLIDGELDTVDTNGLEDIPGDRAPRDILGVNCVLSSLRCRVVLYPSTPQSLRLFGHLPALSEEWPRLPLVLIEVKRNASRKPGGDRKLDLSGFMFGNQLYDRLPYIIGIAMAADRWSHARFYRSQRPADFNRWEEWSQNYYLNTRIRGGLQSC
ncbi:hypothetical protein B0J17DRAFT_631666 [Rhizoctonia solani]|nr:hypothetical protein B0J17DRAFT_631666 [Rhizoctonia solani]